MKYLSFFFFFILFQSAIAQAHKQVVQLYPGAAPGSESWQWNETESYNNLLKQRIVQNVSHPTLTVFPADPAIQATGAAVVICPGGGFHFLSIDNEGNDLAELLSKKGITCFVLKYRLQHVDSIKNGKSEKIERLPVVPLAIADGKNAIAYVRKHAGEYNLKTDRIGIIGFSAGGTIAVTAASENSSENRPDFVVAIYPYLPKALQKNAPENAPPLFIAAASDDPLNIDNQNVILYNKWLKAKDSVEMHIYKKGGHGFGMKTQNLSSDSWVERLNDWMDNLGLLKPLSNEKTAAQKSAEGWASLQKYYEDLVHNDWAWLSKYSGANTKVAPPTPGEKRVIFMGNSITENWGNVDPQFFKDNNYISRGIGGQVSAQMLVRFREDVINLKPLAVVIEAGTNDLAQNRGYITPENIFGNIVSMCELAKANGIKPIIGSVLPATDFSWHRGLEPAEKIVALNVMLKAYAAKNHFTYIDYWSAMVNDKKGLKVELAQDGLVHPNLAGYKVMEPLAEKAITEALSKK
jgi:acetyl esterase/lipase/lysophospholipase L1-like esterase